MDKIIRIFTIVLIILSIVSIDLVLENKFKFIKQKIENGNKHKNHLVEDDLEEQRLKYNVKKNDYSNVISFCHTIFFQNKKFDEISIYFSVLNGEVKGQESISKLVLNIRQLLKDDNFLEIDPWKTKFIADIKSIDIIQRSSGIQLIVEKSNEERFYKVIDTNCNHKIIAIEIIGKLFGVEV